MLKKRDGSEKSEKSRYGRRKFGNDKKRSKTARPTKRKNNRTGKERQEASDLGKNPGKSAPKGRRQSPPTLNSVEKKPRARGFLQREREKLKKNITTLKHYIVMY